MRTTRNLKRLTDLTPLLLACALAFACGAAAQARQDSGREIKPAASAASLLDALKQAGSKETPEAAQAREDAVEGLKRAGHAAVPAITDFLNSEKGPARVYAAAALA